LETLTVARQPTQLFIYPFARWSFQRNFVSKGCNFVILGRITENKLIGREMGTIIYAKCVKVSVRHLRLFPRRRSERKLRC